METETALVRPQGRVELNTIAAVDLDVPGVILPHDAELDDPLGDGHHLEGDPVLGVLGEQGAVLERAYELYFSRPHTHTHVQFRLQSGQAVKSSE